MSFSMMTTLLWIVALSSGLMAGVYFAFSSFIMKAFDELDTAQSVAAMNSINEIILRSLFMPLFFISSLLSMLLIVLAFIDSGEAGSTLALISGIVYFIGMFICTVVFNVPLNNSLARVDRNSSNTQQIWSHYLKNWTRWNHVRALSSLVTCVLCIGLLTNDY